MRPRRHDEAWPRRHEPWHRVGPADAVLIAAIAMAICVGALFLVASYLAG